MIKAKKHDSTEEKFSKLYGILPDPAVIVDGKGTFLAITSSVTTISGYQKEELVGTNFMTSELITSHSKSCIN